MIDVKNLKKSFHGQEVLKDLSLKIGPTDFISILGSSGCGKSTFLRILAGLEEKTGGEIQRDKNLRLSFVFQDPCLLPWLTVKENILLPFQLLKEESPENSKLSEILNLVKLTAAADLYPHELSGGMKMRASIARALMTSPKILLMDEPFAALDEVTRFHLQDELRKIATDRKMAVIFVTHSISEAAYLSDRVLFLGKPFNGWGADLKIDFESERNQSLKINNKYNDYVTQLSSYFQRNS